MRRLWLLILLPAAAAAAPTARRAPARMPGLTVTAPNASLGAIDAPTLFASPSLTLNAADSSIIIPEDTSSVLKGEAPKIIVPERKKLIIPDAPEIIKPEKVIVEADRELTEEELAVEKPSTEELQSLAKSLTTEGDPNDRSAADGEMAASLSASFDGAMGLHGEDLDIVQAYFKGDAGAPQLSKVEAAAHAMFRGLLPAHYHRLPATARYDRSENPSTGHLWSAETGHIIELAPVRRDSKGNVPSAFGSPNTTFVQEKVEQLLQFAHEYAHVVFDAVVRKTDNHSPVSSYAAMTEGFAVTLEQALVERVIDNPMLLGLSPRDVADFTNIAMARRDWLNTQDNHYSEGIQSWWRAFKTSGDKGVTAFLNSLSAGRMTKTLRADPAYQLAAGDAHLLSGYLGKDAQSEIRQGLEAYAKAARGEELTAKETALAEAAIEKAGPEGRRRVFIRSLFDDRRIPDTAERRQGPRWYENDGAKPLVIGPAFALARLSAVASEELGQFLAETVSTAKGARRLFGAAGPNEKLVAITKEAEGLTFSEKTRSAWDTGLAEWVTGVSSDLHIFGNSLLPGSKNSV